MSVSCTYLTRIRTYCKNVMDTSRIHLDTTHALVSPTPVSSIQNTHYDTEHNTQRIRRDTHTSRYSTRYACDTCTIRMRYTCRDSYLASLSLSLACRLARRCRGGLRGSLVGGNLLGGLLLWLGGGHGVGLGGVLGLGARVGLVFLFVNVFFLLRRRPRRGRRSARTRRGSPGAHNPAL